MKRTVKQIREDLEVAQNNYMFITEKLPEVSKRIQTLEWKLEVVQENYTSMTRELVEAGKLMKRLEKELALADDIYEYNMEHIRAFQWDGNIENALLRDWFRDALLSTWKDEVAFNGDLLIGDKKKKKKVECGDYVLLKYGHIGSMSESDFPALFRKVGEEDD